MTELSELADFDENLVRELADKILDIEDQLMHQVNPVMVHEKILKLLSEEVK
jgi:hypothetical protein